MSIKQNFPEVSPSLLLDFANSKTLDPTITFTRASVGTYVASNGLIKTAAADEARFDHDPTTGESLGLLIEESRTNDARNSSDFSSTRFASGYGDKSTVNTNVTTAPDGTLTADQIVTVTTSTQNRLAQSHSVTNGSYYTYSIFIKYDNLDSVQFYLGYGAHLNTSASFTFSTETVNGGGGTAGFVKYPNGWYRIFFTGEAFSTGSAFSGFISGTTGNLRVYVWGEQIEEGSFPTSYIPTSGTTVTRAVDTAKITGTNFTDFYNQSEGTLSINANNIKEGRYVSALTSGTTGSPDTLNLYRKDDDQWRIYNTSQVTFSSTDSDANAALAYSVSGTNRTAVAAWKGDLVNSPTDTTSIPFTLLQIGAGAKGTGISNGHISRLSYYSQRLTDSQLQNLTK